MKLFGPKNALAKYFANATFSQKKKVALSKDPMYKPTTSVIFFLPFAHQIECLTLNFNFRPYLIRRARGPRCHLSHGAASW